MGLVELAGAEVDESKSEAGSRVVRVKFLENIQGEVGEADAALAFTDASHTIDGGAVFRIQQVGFLEDFFRVLKFTFFEEGMGLRQFFLDASFLKRTANERGQSDDRKDGSEEGGGTRHVGEELGDGISRGSYVWISTRRRQCLGVGEAVGGKRLRESEGRQKRRCIAAAPFGKSIFFDSD